LDFNAVCQRAKADSKSRSKNERDSELRGFEFCDLVRNGPLREVGPTTGSGPYNGKFNGKLKNRAEMIFYAWVFGA